jgi:hypothetical protein
MDGATDNQVSSLKHTAKPGNMAELTEIWVYLLAQVLVKAQVLPQQPLRLLVRPVAHHLPPFRQGTHASEGDTRRPCDKCKIASGCAHDRVCGLVLVKLSSKTGHVA